jgi:hypothetical protein
MTLLRSQGGDEDRGLVDPPAERIATFTALRCDGDVSFHRSTCKVELPGMGTGERLYVPCWPHPHDDLVAENAAAHIAPEHEAMPPNIFLSTTLSIPASAPRTRFARDSS